MYDRAYLLEPEEPAAACACSCCGQAIVDGEECMELDGEYYHLDCFKDNAVDILCQFGARKTVAEAV